MVARKTVFLIAILSAPFALVAEPAQATDEFPDTVAGSEDADLLVPASQWALSDGDSFCRLIRRFGSDQDPHLLVIEQSSPGEYFGLTMAGSSYARFRSGSRTYLGMQSDWPMVRFDMPPTGEMDGVGDAIILPSVGIGHSGQDEAMRLRVGASEDDDEKGERSLTSAQLDTSEAAKIDRIVLKRGGRVVSLETGNLGEPFAALNSCTSGKLAAWGLDPEKHQAFRPVRWINQDDIVRRIQASYPQSALIRGEQAIFRMRVIVDESGSVSDCVIEASTTTRKLESPACEEMMQARFDPALDEQGNPMRSFYSTTISYRIG